MQGAEIKRALREDKVVLGTFASETWSPNIGPILAAAGFDFMFIDTEHGNFDMQTVTAIIWAARGAGIAPIVRPPSNDRASLMRPLDAGAAGLLVPMVETKEYAQQVIRYTKYPPVGQRGLAMRRAHAGYRAIPVGPYIKQANEDTLIVAQIETLGSVNNLEEILGVGNIDVAFVGPTDLSTTMGYPGQPTHPEVVKTIERIVEVARRREVAAGIQLMDVKSVQEWIRRGVRFISYCSDAIFIVDNAARDLAQIREAA
ncbi:MAG: hypothetical protein HY660_08380 [Armatimonadetes bacterium]|nr:hypothetical protein [Armatimonadota bacterium]